MTNCPECGAKTKPRASYDWNRRAGVEVQFVCTDDDCGWTGPLQKAHPKAQEQS